MNGAAPATNNGTKVFSITVDIAGSVGHVIQGDEVDVTVTFGLYQDAFPIFIALRCSWCVLVSNKASTPKLSIMIGL